MVDVPEVMRCVLICILEGAVCLLEVLEMMRCVLLRIDFAANTLRK